jgi:Tol biopolymer transport system component
MSVPPAARTLAAEPFRPRPLSRLRERVARLSAPGEGRGRRSPVGPLRLSAVLLLALLLASPARAQVPADARWRTFDTPNFRVSYVEGLDSVARRAADRAEVAYATLAEELVAPPRGRIELVVADNVDFANGYATPIPRNRIVIYAFPPVSQPSLAFYDDWLQLLVTHELVHIFHLDHARGLWRPLRAVFGRNPLLFPQVFAPGWIVEGLATYFESRLTGAGRVRGTQYEMALRTAILEDAFFTIDRVTGNPVRWPGGESRYIYGSLFVHHLASAYGAERIPALVDRVGGQILPYRLQAAARATFGTTLTRAWTLWEDSLRAHYGALADSLRAAGLTEPEILTSEGRFALHPRFHPAGEGIVYASATGREEPSTRLVVPGGGTRVLAPRSTLGPSSWLPDGQGLLFSQHNFVDPTRVYTDLYRLGLDGREEQITRAARIWDPSLHPDGERAVAVENAGGTNVLVSVDLRSGERRALTAPSLDVHWAFPRWSPRGDRIAVSRWRAGGFYDVVLLDPDGSVVRELTADRAVDGSPAWSPDGRYVVFGSDRTGIANLYAFDLQEDRLLQVTNVLTGAFQPDVSPDGRWIAFSYYRVDGYAIARIPFEPAGWRPAPAPRPEVGEVAPGAARPAAGSGPDRAYSARETIGPTMWLPIGGHRGTLGLGAGVLLLGQDVVERHQWTAEALLYPAGRRLDGGVAYRFNGLGNPVVDLSLEQAWRVGAATGTLRGPDGQPIPSARLRRDRELDASLSWLRRRWRSTGWAGVGGSLRQVHREWAEPEAPGALPIARLPADYGARLEAGYSTARGFGFSIGPQEGFSTLGRLEGRRQAGPVPGLDTRPEYLRLTTRNRGFQAFDLPGFAHHVLALRLDAGMEAGSLSPGFGVGGATGAPAPLPVDLTLLGRGLSYPVRGYAEGVQQGSRAFSASAEYRFPIRLVERGVGIVPVFVDRLWGDVFADVGGAWCPGQCEVGLRDPIASPRPLASLGAEVVLDLDVGYFADLPLRFGVALPLRPTGPTRQQLYLRLGRSF